MTANPGKATIQVRSLKNQALIADKCLVADSFFMRFIGLMGKRGLDPGHGLLLTRVNDIHMWFMRFPIDAVFLRSEGEGRWTVTSTRARLRANKLLPVRDGRADATLELPAGTVERWGITEGDQLCTS
jgi:uncharacterized protein